MIPTIVFTMLLLQPSGGPQSPSEEAVMLDDYGPCGLTSLYLVCQLRQVSVEWDRLKELLGPQGADGTHSFADLSRVAAALRMYPVGLEATRQGLNNLPMPAIVQVHNPADQQQAPHLLVLLRPEADGVFVLDPPYSAYFVPDSHFSKGWTGRVLVFARDEGEAERIRTTARTSSALPLILGAWVVVGAFVGLAFTRRRWTPAGRLWLAAARAHMPRRIPLGLGAIACIVLGSLVANHYWQPQAPPRCSLDRAVVDLGELTPGTNKHTVSITNRGSSPLQIRGILSTCSCAVVKAPEVIKPGRSAVLEIDLSVTPGPGSARLFIESNDPDGRNSVVLSWHGKAPPRLVPMRIDAQGVPNDRPYERTVRLVYPGGKSALLPSLECWECDSLVQIRPGKNDPMASRFARSGLLSQVLGEFEVHVEVQPPSTPGLLTSKCTLYFQQGETVTPIDLALSIAFVGADLVPETSAVVFSALRPDELKGQERLIRVTNAGPGDELVVQDIPPWLHCEVVRKAAGESLVRLTVIQPPPEPLAQHTLHLMRAPNSDARTPLRISVFAPPG